MVIAGCAIINNSRHRINDAEGNDREWTLLYGECWFGAYCSVSMQAVRPAICRRALYVLIPFLSLITYVNLFQMVLQ